MLARDSVAQAGRRSAPANRHSTPNCWVTYLPSRQPEITLLVIVYDKYMYFLLKLTTSPPYDMQLKSRPTAITGYSNCVFNNYVITLG